MDQCEIIIRYKREHATYKLSGVGLSDEGGDQCYLINTKVVNNTKKQSMARMNHSKLDLMEETKHLEKKLKGEP